MGLTDLQHRAGRPVDARSLAVVRIAFGLVIVWEAYRYWVNGWIESIWLTPAYHVPYDGFTWLAPMPGHGLYGVWLGIAVCVALIAAGRAYRPAAAVLVLLFGYVFLLERTRYLNHFYLMILLAGILAVVPADRVWSVGKSSGIRTVPTWALWLVRFQVAVMYVGGAVAKLNGDWLAGRPLDQWLASNTDLALVGPLLDEVWAGRVFAWAGLGLDLLIVPALFWRPTRVAALVAAGAFHLLNSKLFQIGVFPPLAMAATTVLLPPDWPATTARGVRSRLARAWSGGVVDRAQGPQPEIPGRPDQPVSALLLGLVGLYAAIQVVVPLRHLVLPGDPSWTEAGHTFAWHMKLRDKDADISYTVTDPSHDDVWVPDLNEYLQPWQRVRVAADPGMIVRFAQHLGSDARDRGIAEPVVYANAVVSLNGRPAVPLIDTSVDLLDLGDPQDAVMPHPDEQLAR